MDDKITNKGLVRVEILKEIASQKNYDYKHYGFSLYNQLNRIIEKEAEIHSVLMEETDKGCTNPETFKKILKIDHANLKEAAKYAIPNFKGFMSLAYIENVGKLVEPEQNQCGFRRKIDSDTISSFGRVTIGGATITPPAPEKIVGEFERFIGESQSLDNIVEKAVHAHFHLARVHPFFDGNGRTARLVQNAILMYGLYPPIVIKKEERSEYSALLDDAVSSYHYNDRNLMEEQCKFYDYLASKIKDSFKEIDKTIIKKLDIENKR